MYIPPLAVNDTHSHGDRKKAAQWIGVITAEGEKLTVLRRNVRGKIFTEEIVL